MNKIKWTCPQCGAHELRLLLITETAGLVMGLSGNGQHIYTAKDGDDIRTQSLECKSCEYLVATNDEISIEHFLLDMINKNKAKDMAIRRGKVRKFYDAIDNMGGDPEKKNDELIDMALELVSDYDEMLRSTEGMDNCEGGISERN